MRQVTVTGYFYLAYVVACSCLTCSCTFDRRPEGTPMYFTDYPRRPHAVTKLLQGTPMQQMAPRESAHDRTLPPHCPPPRTLHAHDSCHPYPGQAKPVACAHLFFSFKSSSIFAPPLCCCCDAVGRTPACTPGESTPTPKKCCC